MHKSIFIALLLFAAQATLAPDEIAQRIGALLIAQNDCSMQIPSEAQLRRIVARWGGRFADFLPDGAYGGLVELHAARTMLYLMSGEKKSTCRELQTGLRKVFQ